MCLGAANKRCVRACMCVSQKKKMTGKQVNSKVDR